MKYIILLVIISIMIAPGISAQVSISEFGDKPDSASILDLQSVSKGFLPPRLNSAEMYGIPNPPPGLMVYNSTVNSMFYFDGESWQMISNRDRKSCGIVNYEGHDYQTVIIGTQCWLKENLNVGNRIDGSMDPADDGNIEKYCYNNEEDSCSIYGGLYNWDEMMEYDTLEGGRGICPEGWHIPTEYDWCILAHYIDETVDCDPLLNMLGTDAGHKLKAGYAWFPYGLGSDSVGFTAVGAGQRRWDGTFADIHYWTNFWTSTPVPDNKARMWYLIADFRNIFNDAIDRADGLSVRCVRD